jgi:hypothetical protein
LEGNDSRAQGRSLQMDESTDRGTEKSSMNASKSFANVEKSVPLIKGVALKKIVCKKM